MNLENSWTVKSKEIIDSLTSFGFTQTEAKVYTFLVASGKSTVSHISKSTGIHIVQVYNALRSLKERGFVDIANMKPRFFKAVDPEIVLEKVYRDLGYMKERLIKDLKGIEGVLKSRKKFTKEKPLVWMVYGYVNVLNNIEKVIKTSKIDILAWMPMDLLNELYESFINARERGIEIYFIIYPSHEAKKHVEILENFRNVKLHETGDLMIIGDSKIGFYAKRSSLKKKNSPYGLLIYESSLIKFLIAEFEYSWLRLTSLFEYKERLPKKFTCHKLLVFALRQLLNEGKNVEIEVVGRSLKNDKRVRITGLVTATTIEYEKGVWNFTIMDRKKRIFSIGGQGAFMEDIAFEWAEIKKVS